MPTVTVGTPALALFGSTNIGMPYDLVLGLAPLVTATGGGVVGPEGQIVNVDLTDPTLAFLYNGFLSPPFAPASLSFVPSTPAGLSMQMAVADPIALIGIRLSQPTRLTIQ
jgi:hypothetical protein